MKADNTPNGILSMHSLTHFVQKEDKQGPAIFPGGLAVPTAWRLLDSKNWLMRELSTTDGLRTHICGYSWRIAMSDSERLSGAEWQWKRREVIIRDDYECQECSALGGKRGDTQLHVHHTKQVQDGGGDDLDNLITLCVECHVSKHSTNDTDTGQRCPSPTAKVYDERDTDSGRFEPTYSETEVIEALRAADDGTTTEIAERVGCAYRTAYEYLTRLENEGTVTRRKLGTTSVWQLTEDTDE
jgi:5-methylcytosine-specific restriction endonuclease McrA